MPISAERRAELMRAAEKRQFDASKQAGTEVGSLVVPKPGEQPALTKEEGQARIDAIQQPQGPEAMDRLSQGTHDMADVTANSVTFGQASRLRSAVTGKTQEQVNADSDEAKKRLGPGMTLAGEVAGKAMATALLPESLFASVPAAAVTSGALGVGGLIGDTLGRGKPAPSPEELLMTGGISAAGGALGKYVGDRLGELWARSLSQSGEAGDSVPRDTALYKQALDQLQNIKVKVDGASKAINDSEVTVRNDFLRGKVNELASSLAKSRMTYRVGAQPYAKEAINTLKKFVADGSDPTFAEINEIRQIIQKSVLDTKGALVDGVTSQDAATVKVIDKYLRNVLSNLDKTPNAVGNGNVAMAVEGWKTMNSLVPQQAKGNLIAKALDAADLSTKNTGVSFDRALQSQFKILYNSPQGKAEFRGVERELIRKMAEGTNITQQLNKFDRILGHGALSQVYNTLARIPRGATSRIATQNARDILGNLAPEAALEAPSKLPGTLGALIGQTAGEDFIGEKVKLVPRQ